MSKPGLSFGLNLSKKAGTGKPGPPKKKPIFGGDDGSDDEGSNNKGKSGAGQEEEIGELGGFDAHTPPPAETTTKKSKHKSKSTALPTQPPPPLKSKKPDAPPSAFDDLASSFTARKNAEAAEELDASIYDYDKVYDSFKPQKKKPSEEEAEAERKPRYMKSLLAAASVRKRDALIAEERKIARDREAEGEEYADKEKFVTEAYRKQQEENKRIEEEEKKREEEEAKKNKSGGMNAFYKGLLNKGEERHQEMMKAAEEKAKAGPEEDDKTPQVEGDDAATQDQKAKKINDLGGSVAVNEDGEIVDKRELLRGGLNVGAKKEAQVRKEASRPKEERREAPKSGFVGSGGKGAMRERQSRMLEQQLEAALKRTRDEEEEEREKVETANKSRKTEADISSAKERYLARKREAEEAKKKGLAP